MDQQFSLSLKQILLGALLLGLVVVCVTVVVFATGQRAGLRLGAPQPTPTPTMPPLPKAMTATPRVQPTLPKAASPTPDALSPTQDPGGGDSTQSLKLTEDDIYAMIDQSSGEAPVSISDVEITPQGVALAGYANLSGIAGNFELYGIPYVENGYLRFRLLQLTLDGSEIPAFLFPTIEEQINLLFEQAFAGYAIQDVTLGEGEIILIVSTW